MPWLTSNYAASLLVTIITICGGIFATHATSSEKVNLRSEKLYQKILTTSQLAENELKAAKNCGSNLFDDQTSGLKSPKPEYQLRGLAAVQDEIGDVRKFNAIDFSSNQATKEITARTERVGVHAYFYVDTSQSFNGERLDAVLDLFDNQIYKTNTDVFGSEVKPGIDGDDRITILFLAIEEPSSVVGDIAGYFWSGNQFPRSQVSRSNEREMLYIDVGRLQRFGVADVAGTLAHEFQHLIHWNYDATEDVWVNEGLSEYATFRNDLPLTNSPSLFLDDPDHTLMRWTQHPRDYARAFLWIAYLADHYGGDELARSIVANPNRGLSALRAILLQRDPDSTLEEIFGNWLIANYLDEPGNLYGYPSLDLPTLRATETFAFLPVSTRSAMVNTFAGDYYVFEGGEDLTAILNGMDDDPDFAAKLIKLYDGTPAEVLDFPLDGDNAGELSVPEFGISVSKVVLMPYYLDNSATASAVSYQFSATGSGGPQAFADTLHYHDEASRTVITSGLPSRVVRNERFDSYAVRFTPASNGILVGAELGVWSRTGSGGALRFYVYDDDENQPGYPGAKLDSVDVSHVTGTPGFITWNQVDFGARNFEVSEGEDFHLAWELVSAGFGDTVFAALDTGKVATNRSSVFVRERQSWQKFEFGLNFFVRAIISVPVDPTVPTLTAGIVQNPVFSQVVDLFAISENPLHSASVEGEFALGDSVAALQFHAVNDSETVFIADDFELFSSGVARIAVAARHRFGIAVGTDTLELSINLIDAQRGGTVSSADSSLNLKISPGNVTKPTYFTTTSEKLEEGEIVASDDERLAATGLVYRIGPAGLNFSNMLELSFHYGDDHVAVQSENDLTIAYLEGKEWLQLGGELYRGRKTITALVNRTGVYGLFVKKYAETSEGTNPHSFYLKQNYPNPFNPKTTITFGLEHRGRVMVRIINLKGQLISTLVNAELSAGDHVVEWDATDDRKLPVASGVYLYQLQAGDFVDAKKLLLVR